MRNPIADRVKKLLEDSRGSQRVVVIRFASMDEPQPSDDFVVIGGSASARAKLTAKLREKAKTAQESPISSVGPEVMASPSIVMDKPLIHRENVAPGRWVPCSRCRQPFEIAWNDSRQRCPCGGSAR